MREWSSNPGQYECSRKKVNIVMQTITEYYESYDEDSRLRDSKAKQTEFITTTIFLNRYLKDNSRILEVGAD